MSRVFGNIPGGAGMGLSSQALHRLTGAILRRKVRGASACQPSRCRHEGVRHVQMADIQESQITMTCRTKRQQAWHNGIAQHDPGVITG